jgi:CHAD domain-containing protein
MKTAAAGDEADFHQWRKRAKDLWHELRLLGDAWPAPLGATADEAHRLSELLGDHHDLAVLPEDLLHRKLGEEVTLALDVAIDRRQGELVEWTIGLGYRLYAERPQDFGCRLRRYWETWRG